MEKLIENENILKNENFEYTTIRSMLIADSKTELLPRGSLFHKVQRTVPIAVHQFEWMF